VTCAKLYRPTEKQFDGWWREQYRYSEFDSHPHMKRIKASVRLVGVPVETQQSNFANLSQNTFFLILRIVAGGVQTGSTRHRGHLLSYCACPGWLWGWRIIRWNEDWQGKPKYSEKPFPSATLSTTNPTWPDPGSNPGRRGGKPATNRLSHGAAKSEHLPLEPNCSVRLCRQPPLSISHICIYFPVINL
jgi:hypothetical protein